MKTALAVLFACVVGCDQAGKHVATALPPGGIDVIPGFFKLVYAENPGVAFSSFVGAPSWLIATFVLIMIGLLSVSLWRTPAEQLMTRIGYVLILGGAIGNLVDRVRFGHVIDFILWHVGEKFYWPVFNPADAAVVVGITLLLVQDLMKKRVRVQQ